MQLGRAGGELPQPRCAPPFVHASERRRVQAPDARPRTREQQRRPNRARLLLVDAVRQRARRGRPVRRLRSAPLARRVVGMCDSNSGDHDGESGTDRGRYAAHRACPAIAGDYRCSAGPGPNRADPRPRSRIASSTPEARNPAAIGLCARWRDPDSNRGHHDFQSCGAATEFARFTGIFVDVGLSGSVRAFPYFAAFCRMKRPTEGSVGLLVGLRHSLRLARVRPAAEVSSAMAASVIEVERDRGCVAVLDVLAPPHFGLDRKQVRPRPSVGEQ
jgi:hypothetical protein